jgi:hypothetical protein
MIKFEHYLKLTLEPKVTNGIQEIFKADFKGYPVSCFKVCGTLSLCLIRKAENVISGITLSGLVIA